MSTNPGESKSTDPPIIESTSPPNIEMTDPPVPNPCDPTTPDAWRPVPLSRHLNTIGIGEVFLSPPPKESLYSYSGREKDVDKNTDTDADADTPIETWEILGVVKALPEDFVVREIGGVSVADLNDNSKEVELWIAGDSPNRIKATPFQRKKKSIHTKKENVKQDTTQVVEEEGEEARIPIVQYETQSEEKKILTTDLTDLIMSPPDEQHQSIETEQKDVKQVTSVVEEAKVPIVQCATPFDVIQNILMDCISDRAQPDLSGSELLKSIQKLESSALTDIEKISDGSQDPESFTEIGKSQSISTIIIPPINDNIVVEVDGANSPSVAKMNMNRSTFHRSLKVAFPLLKSSTMSEEESTKYMDRLSSLPSYKSSDLVAPRLIQVVKDTLFRSLIPFLATPKEDLLSLYQFRNKGCSPPKTLLQNDGLPKKRKRGGMEKRMDIHDAHPNDETLLRLKPDLPRESRKEIHLLIANACRGFETGTRKDILLPDSKLKTTAIVVRWSKQTRRNAMKRQKINSTCSINGDQQNEVPQHTLCIMRKRNQEHHHAITHLLSTLKCRSSDVGIAGIKDMRAITYQFCTLRNIRPRRARKANGFLKENGIVLSHFKPVKWLLNKGFLKGNQFEITVRDLKRVQILRKEERGIVSIRELDKECYEKHLNAMIGRVKLHGFVNFFGEQRIGNAGSTDEIGVRPMDVGKEMLKNNFSKAIDLLMSGRTKCRSGSYVESEGIRNFRSTWKETGGDVNKTLSSLPKGHNLARERAILRGLKRYGTDKALLAIRCLSFNERIFWINAYQSYVWNLMATERILLLGPTPAMGDLFLNEEGEINIVSDPSIVRMDQVVLPLPGYKTIYPSNRIGTMYKEILIRDNIKFEKDAIPEATAKGSYRHLIVRPVDLKVNEYTRRGECITTVSLHFSLPSGSYATMLLRELMVSIISR